MKGILEAVSSGRPLYILPYKEPKVWGVNGIGEYWYGAEEEPKSSIAKAGDQTVPMADVIARAADEVLGKDVVRNFGKKLPLVKILTPKSRLSVQFHDKKNELWVVTGIDRSVAGDDAWIILGFSEKMIRQAGSGITARYREALEKYGRALNDLIDMLERKGFKERLESSGNAVMAAQGVGQEEPEVSRALSALNLAEYELKKFYNYRTVKVGDVIPVSARTLHSLGPGVEVVEPQIPGPTQSMEDGATYPVRYYFPGFEREGVKKELDISRTNEINADIVKEAAPEVIKKTTSITVERLPGRFEAKGLAVNRITIFQKGAELEVPSGGSFHSLVAVKGKAKVVTDSGSFDIPGAAPGGEMMIMPASSGNYHIVAEEAGTQIIDTFTPLEI